MNLLLANLLIRYTPCSVSFDGGKTSLVWIWRGNSWRWVLREHVGMLIIPVEGSIIKALVKSDPKTKIGERIQKQRVLLFLKEVRDKAAYDPTYKSMRKQWRAEE